ncbi:MAG: hypothetical protein HDS67_06835 [Bacteroidales bacterium]|nr:hypothetical protein [Bacteroidales bacterium]
MKMKILLKLSVVAMFLTAGISSCSSPKNLVFANRDWHVSNYYGQLIDADTTYRITFGDVLIPDPLTIISSSDSVNQYPGMEKFMTEILHTTGLDDAEVLFYAPEMQTMLVTPRLKTEPTRPAAVSCSLNDEQPITYSTLEDEIEKWDRQPDQMYTYTYVDKRKKQILIVDFYNYGETPVAQIFIYKTHNKHTDKMGLRYSIGHSFFRHDVAKLERDIDFWSWILNAHRNLSISNYKIGKNPKSIR